MMRKKIKRRSALVLTFALMFSVFASTEIFAAPKIEQTADHSMTLKLPEYTPDELSTAEVTADIYKVASIASNGKFTAESAFEELGDEFSSLAAVDNAAQWAAINEAAVAATESGDITPLLDDAEFTGRSLTVDELTPGVYLIMVPQVTSELYKYDFLPALVALPGTGTNDDWVKSVEVTLKGLKEDREGFLVIEKELLDYNTTNDSAVFVFEVKAVADEETVYNEVLAIDFAELGSAPAGDWVKVGPIKAGAVATVKEVYTGASYRSVGINPQTVTIKADPALDDVEEDEREAVIAERLAEVDEEVDITVTFENAHNDVPNGGTGIVNRFEATENGWHLERDDQGQDTRPQQ